MHADAELDVEPSCLADLNDDLLRKIASRLAESDLASAVALKRCSSRFNDLATPLVANAVSRNDCDEDLRGRPNDRCPLCRADRV